MSEPTGPSGTEEPPSDVAPPDDSGPPAESVVQAVVTEHFVLQSARGAATSEAAGRLSGLLATVSAALIATGFLAGTPMATAFFSLVVPFLALLGLLTYRRLVEISAEDMLYVRDIQEIRRWYATELPAGLPSSMTAARTAAPQWTLAPTRTAPGLLPLLWTTASVVALVTSAICGGGAALLVSGLADGAAAWSVTAAVVTLVVMAAFTWDQDRRLTRAVDAR